MQLVSCHAGVLRTLSMCGLPGASDARSERSFVTGLAALDALPPGGAFRRGAVHELLFSGHTQPTTVAMILARSAADLGGGGSVVWSDPLEELYPPALTAFGLPPEQLFFLRARGADEHWAVAECLRCKGVAATVVAPPRLSRVEARRLQLAAERGGGVAIFLRQVGKSSTHYAAATRWLVEPAAGDRGVQRWSVQLIQGHGGRVGRKVVLEFCRDTDTNHVRAVEAVADRPDQAQTARASA